jgi:hypothetical protein
MRVPLAAAATFVFAAATLVGMTGSPAQAAARRSRANAARPHAPAPATVRGKIAVQPIDGPTNMESMRGLVVRIVRGRGYRTMTSLPRYEGTGQYPILARDHHLSAFVTADVEERGKWQRITFLVWNGATGSILGRWTASGQGPVLARAVGRGFWAHLGPAMRKASAPPSNVPGAAPPMRIDASEQAGNSDGRGDEFPVASR